MGIGWLVGADRDLDAEKPGRRPASRDSGNKVTTGPFTRKPRFIISNAQMLGSGGQALGSVYLVLKLIFCLEENTNLAFLD